MKTLGHILIGVGLTMLFCSPWWAATSVLSCAMVLLISADDAEDELNTNE